MVEHLEKCEWYVGTEQANRPWARLSAGAFDADRDRESLLHLDNGTLAERAGQDATAVRRAPIAVQRLVIAVPLAWMMITIALADSMAVAM
jgi:hypothetical protein